MIMVLKLVQSLNTRMTLLELAKSPSHIQQKQNTTAMEPINYLFIALLSWGLIYRLFHSRSRMVVTSPVEDIPLGSLNGFGITMLGGFRSSTSSDYAVYYVMLTALWMPIIPVGCVIASREG